MMSLLIVLLIAFTIVSLLDAWSTVRNIKKGFVETGWPTKYIIGTKPTAFKAYGLMIVISTLVVAISLYSYPWWFCMVPAIAGIIGHSYAVWHNLHQS